MNTIQSKIKFPRKISPKKAREYFKKYKILDFLKNSISNNLSKSLKKQLYPWTDKTYPPEIMDLYRLHEFIILNKRLTILEFGSGWSSLVLAHALMINQKKYKTVNKKIRKSNLFELHILENERKYLNITKKRNIKILGSFNKKINYFFSNCKMTTYNGKFCTEYLKLPQVNPDFIYLDGPDQFKVLGKKNNFTTNHTDMMPMVSDILKFENFLIPGTIIVIDGRTANSQFLKNNFQRKWDYYHDKVNDQNIFYLADISLGHINDKMKAFYRSK
ncbi:hypothetical protein OAZ12_01080 [Candidatus Pelagibacter sp.]|nr:hypothetical protein [Candidatus Pelagibacter sp.]